MLNIVLYEPEIPANTREYRKNLCSNRDKASFDRAIGI